MITENIVVEETDMPPPAGAREVGVASERDWRPATATYSSFGRAGLIWYEREIGDGWKERRLMPIAAHPTERSESDASVS